MNNKQMISEVRNIAKSNGLVFKQSKTRLNGSFLWQLNDRSTGERVMNNYQLLTAYSDCMSGYINTYNPKTGCFKRW
jgi:hypothetical protein